MKVVIIGVGLIGGSFAKDVKKLYPEAEIIGVDTSDAHLDEALQLGIIDKKGIYDSLATADLVYVSIPVNVLVNELPKILDVAGDETVVMDAGSTKRLICEQVAEHLQRAVGLRHRVIALQGGGGGPWGQARLRLAGRVRRRSRSG